MTVLSIIAGAFSEYNPAALMQAEYAAQGRIMCKRGTVQGLQGMIAVRDAYLECRMNLVGVMKNE
jgi:hypothetical protein